MYNRYIPNGASHTRIPMPETPSSAPPAEHRPPPRDTAPPPVEPSASPGGRQKGAGLSDLLRLKELDSGDVLLLLLVLFLFRDGDDPELLLILALLLLLGPECDTSA